MPKRYLQADAFTCAYGDRTLFTADTLKIYQGDRIGLIGENGCGKSTLLTYLYTDDDVLRDAETAYLPQFDPVANRTTCSGGELMRQRLSDPKLISAPLVFLDEPTSNLDESGIAALRDYLSTKDTFVIISHDRALLDDFCNAIWTPQNGVLRTVAISYKAYRALCEKEKISQTRAYETYAAQREHLRQSIVMRNEAAGTVKKTPSRMGNSEARLHRRQSTAISAKLQRAKKTIQSRLEQLEESAVQKPRPEAAVKLDFSLTDPYQNRFPLRCTALTVRYGEKTVLDKVTFQLPRGARVHLSGVNGSGKTTLQRALIAHDPAFTIAPKARLAYFAQDLSVLDLEMTVLENARRDSVQSETVIRALLARLLFTQDALHRPASTLSGGEKVKLAMLKLFAGKVNFLLLDEVTNYLDIKTIAVLEQMLCEYPGNVLFVSHDAQFAQRVRTHTLLLTNGHAALTQADSPVTDDISLRRSMLQMRQATLADKIQNGVKDREALEAEYQRISRELQDIS